MRLRPQYRRCTANPNSAQNLTRENCVMPKHQRCRRPENPGSDWSVHLEGHIFQMFRKRRWRRHGALRLCSLSLIKSAFELHLDVHAVKSRIVKTSASQVYNALVTIFRVMSVSDGTVCEVQSPAKWWHNRGNPTALGTKLCGSVLV